ncbi:hypothetical protein I302_104784 [Kwoniella bestiolae CBS 10118]|uniref:Uncharacterized protein n=1 Tax=Kwoniella bestiolae CBS 10118 TaxID=1296100 RepID=A0A1B9FRS5_9TREE|nr:hypothetical protein I302_09147 [Kwoniella bestiolae CBS 10118]OCF21468.1 hypothetical protein I302_09147 [Kwoniella bestiolae CBS 10118]
MAEEAQSHVLTDQEKAKLAVCDLIETHLRDTRESLSEWASKRKAANKDSTCTVQADTSLDQKLNARLGTDDSHPESSGFGGIRTVPNPIFDLLSQSSGGKDNFSTGALERWADLKRNLIPRYLTANTAAELLENVVMPYSERFDQALTTVRPRLNTDHKYKVHGLFQKMQIHSSLRTVSDVCGTGDDYLEESRAEWDSFGQLLSKANETKLHGGDKCYLPELGRKVAKASLLLDYPMMSTQVGNVLDGGKKALQDMRREMATCEKQGRTAEYEERKRLVEEMVSLVSYAYRADRAQGGTRYRDIITNYPSNFGDVVDIMSEAIVDGKDHIHDLICLPKLSKEDMDQWIKDIEDIVTHRGEVAQT